MTVTLYGIANCDTVRKARDWLDRRGVVHGFHDYKKAGIDAAHLTRWVGHSGWEKVLNRTGTTFRKLTEAERSDLDADKAIALMLAQPSLIKRPVVEHDGGLLLGFKPDEWAAAL